MPNAQHTLDQFRAQIGQVSPDRSSLWAAMRHRRFPALGLALPPPAPFASIARRSRSYAPPDRPQNVGSVFSAVWVGRHHREASAYLGEAFGERIGKRKPRLVGIGCDHVGGSLWSRGACHYVKHTPGIAAAHGARFYAQERSERRSVVYPFSDIHRFAAAAQKVLMPG